MGFHRGPTIVRNGLVLCLDAANEKSYSGSGTVWSDLSGNGNNATLSGSPTYTNSNVHTLNFDEVDDYALVNNTSLLSTSTYTKLAWFRPESTTANIISGGSDGTHAFWLGGTSTTLSAGHNGAWTTVQYSPGSMLNLWWMGAVTFSNVTGWVLYLNGSQVNTSSNTSTFTGTGAVRIGAYTNAANLFDGDIPYVLIYNRVLTSDEILQNYIATKGRYNL